MASYIVAAGFYVDVIRKARLSPAWARWRSLPVSYLPVLDIRNRGEYIMRLWTVDSRMRNTLVLYILPAMRTRNL